MKNKLIDVSIKTMVGQLPLIITKNNLYITTEFDNIYDSENNCLILPKIDSYLYPDDDDSLTYIKTYKGEFKNIQTDSIIINSIDSKKDIIKDVSHNLLKNRFLTKDGDQIISCDSSVNSVMKQYAHNGGAIGIDMGNNTIQSLSEVLTNILNTLNNMSSIILPLPYNPSDPTDPADPGDPEIPEGLYGVGLFEPNSYTFEDNLLFATNALLKRMNLPEYQYNDIKQGFLYTYYDYNKTITINDEHTASIKGIPGSVVNIRFNDTKTKAYYRIILSRKNNRFIRLSKDELIRVSLVCISNTDEYGSEWDVKDYSIRNAEDLIIEKK